MITYGVVTLEYAVKAKLPDWEEFANEDGNVISWHEYDNAIYMFDNGVAVKLLATDGGEPEDNSFVRDGSWIAGALTEAYAKGFEDGHNDDEFGLLA